MFKCFENFHYKRFSDVMRYDYSFIHILYKTYRPVKSICPLENKTIQCTTMAKTYYIRHYIYRKESIANGTYIQNVTPIGNLF